MSETDRMVPVALCSDCGYVAFGDLTYNFPEPSWCACGRETENTTVADIETVRDLIGGGE